MSSMFPRAVPAAAPPRPYTVSELLAEVAGKLRTQWRDIAVVGEISRWEQRGGHGYFTLKDRTGCLNAIIFASDLARVPFRVTSGLEVVVRGSLDLWAPQGKFQIKAYAIEPVGAGALQLAFEQLKAKLAAEGLFDPARKRRIPALPRRIAIVTSPTGAAIRDILNVLRRRHEGLAITIYPVRVQGDGAAAEVAEGIRAFNRQEGFDVLIVARGGGSPGGSRSVQRRAGRACARGVAHPDDLRDRPRDRRHGERPRRGPAGADALGRGRARRGKKGRPGPPALRLPGARDARLPVAARDGAGSPDGARARGGAAALSVQAARMEGARRAGPGRARQGAGAAPAGIRGDSRLGAQGARQLREGSSSSTARRERVAGLSASLEERMRRSIERRHERLSRDASKLEVLSPLAILARGYAVAFREGARAPLLSASQVRPGEGIRVRLHEGELKAVVGQTTRVPSPESRVPSRPRAAPSAALPLFDFLFEEKPE